MATRYLCPVFLAIAFWLPSAQAAVVPNVVGQTQAAATARLANARLAVGSVTLQASATVPAGQVISQSPAAGTSVADGAWEDLVVSTGPAPGSSPTPGTVRPPPTPASGSVHISIKNEYVLDLNAGPLGSGHRDGTDEAEGVLEKRDGVYVGAVKAKVDSRQTIRGMFGVGNCTAGHYVDSQELNVVGRVVGDFNARSQTVSSNARAAGNEYLALTFTPGTRTRQWNTTPSPNGDTIVACHTLIDTPSGIAFLPLNDARWTMPQGGYVIALPPEGVLNYTDNTVSGASGTAAAPLFNVTKSLWTIRVERL